MQRLSGTFRQRFMVTVMVAMLLLPGGGLVQCYGADGSHIAIEPPHLSACVEIASLPAVSGSQTTSQLSGADCVDVPLPSVLSIRTDQEREQFTAVSLAPSLLYVITVADLMPSYPSSGRLASDEPVLAEQTQLLRSTVLLI